MTKIKTYRHNQSPFYIMFKKIIKLIQFCRRKLGTKGFRFHLLYVGIFNPRCNYPFWHVWIIYNCSIIIWGYYQIKLLSKTCMTKLHALFTCNFVMQWGEGTYVRWNGLREFSSLWHAVNIVKMIILFALILIRFIFRQYF